PSECQEAPPPSSPLIDDRQKSSDLVRSRAYRCGTDLFVTTIRSYPSRIGARPVFTDLRADVTQPEWDAITTRSSEIGSGPLAQRWSETEYSHRDLGAIVASALWVDGLPAHGIGGRFRLALNSLRGSSIPPVALIVTYYKAPGNARGALSRFLSGTAPVFSTATP